MDKNTLIRVGVLVFTLLNEILTLTGLNPIPVSDSTAYEIVSILVTLGAVIWNTYMNNNFSTASRVAEKVLKAVKSGRLTAEKVEKFLTDNENV
ncbi:MAG: phage holin [Clostridia bacterium]|nr:phage holin [Clostridia bacterium]